MSDVLRRVRITGVSAPILEWAVGREISLPVSLLRAVAGSEEVRDLDLRGCPAPSVNGLATNLRLRSAFTDADHHSRQLPFNYQRVPALIRSYVARQLGRRLQARQSEWAEFPGWPLDLSADFVADWISSAAAVPVARTPVVLTHDIDSPAGLRNLVELFIPLEEHYGARSTVYVVPCAWPLDHGLLREVVARGHAVGVHGYDHSNRTPFLSADERRRRLAAGKASLTAYKPAGYRAPSLVRTAALIDDVGVLFEYDSSIPTSGGPFPVFNNGCATARPFKIGRTIEIPISLRRDGTAIFLGHPPAEIADLWIRDAEAVSAARGTAVLLTHCERRFSGNAPMLGAYRQFLEHIASSSKYGWRSARDVATATAVTSG